MTTTGKGRRTARASATRAKRPDTKKASAAPVSEASGAAEPTGPLRKAALVQKLLAHMESQVASNQVKGSLGDFIRLLSLQKELEDQQPREIIVRWVEGSEEGDATKA